VYFYGINLENRSEAAELSSLARPGRNMLSNASKGWPLLVVGVIVLLLLVVFFREARLSDRTPPDWGAPAGRRSWRMPGWAEI
jgi:hypothetical protein